MSGFPLKKGTLNDFPHKQRQMKEAQTTSYMDQVGLISGHLSHLRDNRHKKQILAPCHTRTGTCDQNKFLSTHYSFQKNREGKKKQKTKQYQVSGLLKFQSLQTQDNLLQSLYFSVHTNDGQRSKNTSGTSRNSTEDKNFDHSMVL